MSEDKKTNSLEWYYYVLFGVVAVVALSMTWYSMMDLSLTFLSVPVWLAAGVSFAFDGLAVFLGLLSIKYATTEDSGFWTEVATFLTIATGVYIVVQHAILANYPTAGIVMFASAPVIVGIMLKAMLSYLTRQARRASGRITEKLPSVGWLTWFRYLPQTWRLMSVAMQTRVINAADKLILKPDTHDIFTDKTRTRVLAAQTIVETPSDSVRELVQDNPDTKKQLSGGVVRKELTSLETLSLPVWLPNEPTMSLGKLSRTCLDNGVFDLDTVYRYALTLKGQDVNKTSLSRTLAREKTKLS